MYIGDKDDNDTQRFLLEQKPSNGGEQLIIFGINPSTATPKIDDPTMRKVKSFVENNSLAGKKFDGFLMFNVCAQRSTAPKNLTRNDNLHKMNLDKIRTHLNGRKNIHIWLAFGDNIGGENSWLFQYFKEIVEILKQHNPTYIRLSEFTKESLTSEGNPRHPLYVPDGTPFKEFTKKNSPSKWDFLF